MNRSDTAQLLAMIQAFDRRTIGDTDVLAWHDALTDTDYTDAQTAVRQHFRESREWIMPADVRARVKATRDERLQRSPINPPDITDNARRYMAGLRSNIRNIADGYALPPPAEVADPPPEITERPNRGEALNVTCPHCGATEGERCLVPGYGGTRRFYPLKLGSDDRPLIRDGAPVLDTTRLITREEPKRYHTHLAAHTARIAAAEEPA